MSDSYRAFIEAERQSRLKLWKGAYAEPQEIVPETISDVQHGSICRLWFMPNQTRFVIAGRHPDEHVIVVMPDGHVSGFTSNALVVVLAEAPPAFGSLTHRIKDFEHSLARLAWRDRMPDDY